MKTVAFSQNPWNSRDMAKKTAPNPEKSRMIIFGAILFLLAIGLFIYEKKVQTTPQTNSETVTPTLSPEGGLLADVAVWYPSAPWSVPKAAKESTFYGELSGENMQATVTSDTASLAHFEQANTLSSMGFMPDNNLSADGPGSSVWGYKKMENGKMQIMTFSYTTKPTSSNPNEPLQFNCPCQVAIDVFVSNPTEVK